MRKIRYFYSEEDEDIEKLRDEESQFYTEKEMDLLIGDDEEIDFDQLNSNEKYLDFDLESEEFLFNLKLCLFIPLKQWIKRLQSQKLNLLEFNQIFHELNQRLDDIVEWKNISLNEMKFIHDKTAIKIK